MPSLTWIGKEKVVNHHHEVPFRILTHEYKFISNKGNKENSKDNRIIYGDNLEALKSLLPEFEGRIKCIYIDPPYNTGNEKWVYNDNVNDPKIKKWLGQVVGKEEEDLTRHDKWLCMMYPRLKLLKSLLADNGVLFVSIGEDEVNSLRFILDEIFGRTKRLATFTWKTDGNFDNQAKIKNCHEYILMYTKRPELFEYPPVVDPNTSPDSKLFRPIIRNTIVKNGPKNPISKITLPKGFPTDFDNGVIKARTEAYPHFLADCEVKNGRTLNDVDISSGWSSLDLFKQFLESNFQPVFDRKKQEATFLLTDSGTIDAIKIRNKPSHVISALSGFGSTQSASSTLSNMKIKFDYPKPIELISYLISTIDSDDSEEFIVLDSFAGSGTTGQAVLNLNLQDGGNRKFILIEMLEYVETTTAERIRNVMNGYGEGDKLIIGTGGGFEFFSVGDPLFLTDDILNEQVGLEAIRNYVAYAEGISVAERVELDDPILTSVSPYILGLNSNTAWIFNYEFGRSTSLDMDFLSQLRFSNLTSKPSTIIIYADRCLLSNTFMNKHGIIFKKIPRDITRF